MKTYFLRGLTAALALCLVIELGLVIKNERAIVVAMETQNTHLNKLVVAAQGSPDPLTFYQLSNGHYKVIEVLSKYDGTALVRRYLHTGGTDFVVTKVPQKYLAEGATFHSAWDNWVHT